MGDLVGWDAAEIEARTLSDAEVGAAPDCRLRPVNIPQWKRLCSAVVLHKKMWAMT